MFALNVKCPTATLLSPPSVCASNAPTPIAILLPPSVFAPNASLPTAVLPSAVVLASKA